MGHVSFLEGSLLDFCHHPFVQHIFEEKNRDVISPRRGVKNRNWLVHNLHLVARENVIFDGKWISNCSYAHHHGAQPNFALFVFSLPEPNSSPLRTGRNPKENNRIPTSNHPFSGVTTLVSGSRGTSREEITNPPKLHRSHAPPFFLSCSLLRCTNVTSPAMRLFR